MKRLYRTGWVALTLWLLACGSARAEGVNGVGTPPPGWDPPITVDGGWQKFYFGDIGSFNLEGPWTFTGPALLTVTDAFLEGDQFAVFDNGTLLGDTSLPIVDDLTEVDDPNLAYGDPGYSSGSWLLGDGSHAITIEAIQSPYSAGGAYLRVDTATPEPASFVLLGIGAIGAAGYVRRRRLAATA
jgi:hypothetical protein